MPPDGDAGVQADERYKNTVGYQRNNPGNLMVHSIPYYGKAVDQAKSGPVKFTTMRWGLRALARDLSRKALTKTTIKDIISMYAPSFENDTEGYMAFLERQIGKKRNEKLTFDDATYVALMNAIIKMEIGFGTCPFPDSDLQQAVTDAKTDTPEAAAPAP